MRTSYLVLVILISCNQKKPPSANFSRAAIAIPTDTTRHPNVDPTARTIRVFVALCDNKYQGIVPVPKSIGNGQDAASNLYWGAGYGVKSFFLKKSSSWKLIKSILNPEAHILERIILKHKTANVYLMADAYDGQFIKTAMTDFFNEATHSAEPVNVINHEVYFGNGANLLAFVGHDGLMDFQIDQAFKGDPDPNRKAIMLACYSKNYFTPHLSRTGATPLVWTTGLMAPEAYTLHDAIEAWILNKPDLEVRAAAAAAYSRYQKCSLKAAKGLLVTGW